MKSTQEAPSTPGEFLDSALQARGMTQKDLAFILGIPQQAVSQLVTDKRAVNADLSKALGQVFDVPAEFVLSIHLKTQ